MKKESKRLSPGVIVIAASALIGIALAIVVWTSGGGAASSIEPTPAAVTLPRDDQMIDARMIDFTLTTSDGRTVSLSDFAGRVVFLNFWATWCGPCEREIPALQAFARQQMRLNEGAVVLAVNQQEDPDEVRRYLDARGITSLIVPLDADGAVGDDYGVFNLPVTFVIDRDGFVRYPFYGEITIADMEAYLTALDAAAATPTAGTGA